LVGELWPHQLPFVGNKNWFGLGEIEK
jgi:hypothetical protein